MDLILLRIDTLDSENPKEVLNTNVVAPAYFGNTYNTINVEYTLLELKSQNITLDCNNKHHFLVRLIQLLQVMTM